MLPKTKNGIVQSARPRFHVYLFLSVLLYDSGKFVLYNEWCIGTFKADPQVKSKAQKIFGYGDNPHAFAESWTGGRCIDEVLTDDDLAPYSKSAKQSKQSVSHQHPVARKSPLQHTMPNCIGLPLM